MRDFNYLALPSLTKSKPAVLHSMTCGFTDIVLTAMTAIAGRLVAANVLPETSPSIKRDGTSWEWKLKTGLIATQILPLPPSKWMAEQGSMFNCFPIHHIPTASILKPISLSILNSAVHYWRYQQVKKF